MSISRVVGFAIFLTLCPVFFSQAQTDRSPARDQRTLELVDQLKELIQRAEQEPRSNPWLLQRLRDLVHRYDWPWRVSLLYDDFQDGEYASNPPWIVSNGDFWVARGLGLRSVFDPPENQSRRSSDRKSDNPAMDILGEILWGGKEREERGAQPPPPSSAEIYTKLRVSNAFAVKLQLRSRSYAHGNNRFEIGPYMGDERNWGYRLTYDSGKRESFALMRTAPGRSAVIEIHDRAVDLEDGKPHNIEWRRSDNGEMVVLLDDNEIIRTIDRAYGGPFDGLSVINKGGDYELRQISIHGTDR